MVSEGPDRPGPGVQRGGPPGPGPQRGEREPGPPPSPLRPERPLRRNSPTWRSRETPTDPPVDRVSRSALARRRSSADWRYSHPWWGGAARSRGGAWGEDRAVEDGKGP